MREIIPNSKSRSKWSFFTYLFMVGISTGIIFSGTFWNYQVRNVHGLSQKQVININFMSTLCFFVGQGVLISGNLDGFRIRITKSVAMATIICPIGILASIHYPGYFSSGLFLPLVLLYAVSGLGVGILSGVAFVLVIRNYKTITNRFFIILFVGIAVLEALVSSGLFNYKGIMFFFIAVQTVSFFICIFLLERPKQFATNHDKKMTDLSWCWFTLILVCLADPLQVYIGIYLENFTADNHSNTSIAIQSLIVPVVIIPYGIISDIYIDKVPTSAYFVGLLILKLPLQLAFIFSEDNVVLMIFIVICTYCSIAIMALKFPGVFTTFFGENFFSLNFAAASLTAAVYFILIEVLLGLFYKVNIDDFRRHPCFGLPCTYVPSDVVCGLSVCILMSILFCYIKDQRQRRRQRHGLVCPA